WMSVDKLGKQRNSRQSGFRAMSSEEVFLSQELRVRGAGVLEQRQLRRSRLTELRELSRSGTPSFGQIELVKIIFLKPNSAAHHLRTHLQELSRDTYLMARGHGSTTSTYPQHRRPNCSPNAPRIA